MADVSLASSTRLNVEPNSTCNQSSSGQDNEDTNDHGDQESIKPSKPAAPKNKNQKSNLNTVSQQPRARKAKRIPDNSYKASRSVYT